MAEQPKTTKTVSTRSVRQRHDLFDIPDLKVPSPFQGFINFVREQGVVGLGVGFVVGTAASTLVKSIVANIFNPLIGLATGSNNLAEKSVCLKQGPTRCINPLSYGQVLSDLITFLLILFLVYLLIRGMKLEKLDKKRN